MGERVTVGLLFPGEMGASLAPLLASRGMRVVTTLAGRSDRTTARARGAGIELLPSLAEVACQAALVISLVEPSSARQVAESFCAAAKSAPPGAIFIDANSIGPALAREISAIIQGAGIDFIDASINGLARNLATGGTLFLSGPRADDVSDMIAGAVRTRVLGREVGRASAMKMLLGGLSKGVCGLFLEIATLAHRQDMLPEMMEACTMIYPGITVLVERMLPTYARHAGRRATEMQELQQTAQDAGMDPCLIRALRDLHERLAGLAFTESDGASVASLIERTMGEGLLAEKRSPGAASPASPTAA